MSVQQMRRGNRFMVSAGHDLAALAAYEILEAGGNAVDAGVAAVLTLGVVQSDQVSIAGVAPMLVHLGASGVTWSVAGVGGWPRGLDVDRYIAAHGDTVPLGIARTVVPAAPDACVQALERWGTLRFGDVAARALRHARDGFPMHALMAEYLERYADTYRLWPDSAAIWLPGGRPPRVGERFVQSDLAATIGHLCDEEAAAGADRMRGLAAVRRAFYQGDIAAAIVRQHRELGGLLTAADLSAHRAQVLPAVGRRLHLGGRAVEVRTCGAWCQGPTLLACLAMLDGVDLAALGHNSAEYLHLLAEVVKLGFADREAYLGDPDHVRVPLDTLLDPAYAAARRAGVDPSRASPGLPPPGVIDGFTPWVGDGTGHRAPPTPSPDTSVVAVIDADGNAFCCNPSDPSWDVPVLPGTGLAVSSRGSQSRTLRGHPSCLAPGKRPRLTPNPCLALVDGEWLMPFGTPGGDTQVQANLQFLLNHVVFGMDLQSAVEAPRLITHSQPDSFAPHAADPGKVTVEGRVPHAVTDRLAARGHRVERLPDWTHRVAGVCAVRRETASGALAAGADPRRPSRAMGW
ncbi:MAG: gamma-glutamyltransferase [Ectothiorhodospiraceae bacterium]|nr:gamma-glutamyltransferase [Ectothiorhodospiraceae bacterium]